MIITLSSTASLHLRYPSLTKMTLSSWHPSKELRAKRHLSSYRYCILPKTHPIIKSTWSIWPVRKPMNWVCTQHKCSSKLLNTLLRRSIVLSHGSNDNSQRSWELRNRGLMSRQRSYRHWRCVRRDWRRMRSESSQLRAYTRPTVARQRRGTTAANANCRKPTLKTAKAGNELSSNPNNNQRRQSLKPWCVLGWKRIRKGRRWRRRSESILAVQQARGKARIEWYRVCGTSSQLWGASCRWFSSRRWLHLPSHPRGDATMMRSSSSSSRRYWLKLRKRLRKSSAQGSWSVNRRRRCWSRWRPSWSGRWRRSWRWRRKRNFWNDRSCNVSWRRRKNASMGRSSSNCSCSSNSTRRRSCASSKKLGASHSSERKSIVRSWRRSRHYERPRRKTLSANAGKKRDWQNSWKSDKFGSKSSSSCVWRWSRLRGMTRMRRYSCEQPKRQNWRRSWKAWRCGKDCSWSN